MFFSVNDAKGKRKVLGSNQKLKFNPTELILYCKDLRIMRFCFQEAGPESAKKVSRAAVVAFSFVSLLLAAVLNGTCFPSFTQVKCRTLSFLLAAADLTSPFLPETDLHTLGVGAATSWAPTRIFLSYSL